MHVHVQKEDAADLGVSAGEASRPKSDAAALEKPTGCTCQPDIPCQRMRLQMSHAEGKFLA